VFLVLLVTAAAPLTALPVPSKTAPDQSLADRQVDLAKIQAVVSEPQIAAALAQHGFTSEEVHQRLAQLSPEEVHALSSQLDQLQAAGAAVPQYIWILLAVLLGVLILTAIF
jgi:hypothetical protein